MNFRKVMYCCINFLRKSLQIELDNYMELLDKDIETPLTKQAFSKARQHISPEAFKELFELTSQEMLNDSDMKKLKKYRVYAIDGTEIELSRSKELEKEYPPLRNNTTAPRARVSMLYDVLNDCIIDTNMQSISVSERIMAKKHLQYYEESTDGKGLFILDRGYPSRELISLLENQKYVIRLQKSFNKEIDNSSETDFEMNLHYKNQELKVRVLKLRLSSGETEVLITNLNREEFKKPDFMSIYALRWGIETKYDLLKNKLQLENFSGKTVTSVLQDFYATMYLSNMASAIKIESDEIIASNDNNKEIKHTYVTNQNILIGKLKNNLILIMMNDNPQHREMLLNKLINRLSQYKVTTVPNRHFPRPTEAHKKKRSKNKRAL